LAKPVPTFADKGCHVISTSDPPGCIPLFLDLNYTHEVQWTPFQTHYYSENLVMPGIEPGISGSAAGTMSTKAQKQSI
jgi:hypothetical protein